MGARDYKQRRNSAPGMLLAMICLSLQLCCQPSNGGPYPTPDPALASGNLQLSAEPSGEVAISCAEQVMDLYSGPKRASRVTEARTKELRSCIRLLVPYHEIIPSMRLTQKMSKPWRSRERFSKWTTYKHLLEATERISNEAGELSKGDREKVERLVQWPPSELLRLVQQTMEFGGAPAVILNALSPTKHPVPDVEKTSSQNCHLTKYEYGQRFEDKVITAYMAFLFHAIASLAPFAGFNVSLSRFDLFHGHMFTSYGASRLGILFHAREYPAYDHKTFPLNLGFCQKGSNVPYDASMDLRNILWLAPLASCTNKGVCSDDWLASGMLLILDAKEGGVMYRELLPDYLDDVRTVSEDDFGNLVADVNYLNLGIIPAEDQVFIC